MMGEILLGAISALYLGILTSISPCPLATNIAAISYLGRRLESPRRVFLSALVYTLGRAITYVSLGALIVTSAVTAPIASHFLEKYMNLALGPILIVAGMFLLGLLEFRASGPRMSERLQRGIESHGLWGAGLLGIILALSFCPTSAALFFGSLVPLAIRYESGRALPAVYGIGTALPVLAFAVLIAMGFKRIGSAFNNLVAIDRWARRITGIAFITVGILYSLTYIFEIPALG